MSAADDRNVISAVLDGDQDSYRHLVERYQTGLINHLYAIVGDRDIAEDLAQDAFIRAYNKLSSYNPKFAFSTWLYRIATNLAYSHHRKKKALPLLDEDIIVSDENVHANAAKSETRKRVRMHISKLPTKYRSVVSMYYWQGMSYEEMAMASGVPVGTVKTWMYRAKAQLKEELKDI